MPWASRSNAPAGMRSNSNETRKPAGPWTGPQYYPARIQGNFATTAPARRGTRAGAGGQSRAGAPRPVP